MGYRIIMAVVLVGLGLVSARVEAAELKIAFVDVKAAIENTKQFRAGQKQLESIKKAKMKELESMKQRIVQMDKELTAQSLAMSPDRLSEKQQQLNDLRKQFQRKLQDAQEEMARERNRILQGINVKFGKLIREFGKKNGYDFILTRPAVLYVAPARDVTAQVTRMLDASK